MGRVAYVYFRSFEDARDALHSKSRIILFDKPAMVEAVYESASREEYESRAQSLSPPRYGGRGGDRRGDYGRPRTPDRYREDWDRRGPPRGRDDRDDYRGPPPHRRGGYHDDDGWRGHEHRGGRGRGRGGYRGGYHDDDYGGNYDNYGHNARRENKKDRFPNYLEHIQPEDDPLATRTLFIGNLELNIT